jgi:polysaccharide biosynthesis protein PslH
MRILAVYPYIPYPPNRGAYHRGYQLLRELARTHDVDLLALAEHCEGIEHRAVFAEFCGRIVFVPFQHSPWPKLIPKRLLNRFPATVAHWTVAPMANALSEMLAQSDYDAIHVFDIVLAQYFANEHFNRPFIVDRTRVDLQYQLMELYRMNFSFRSMVLSSENLLKLWFYERAIARRAHAEIVCGIDDEQFVRRYIRRDVRLHVIPNGVDLDYFRPEAALDVSRASAPTILFCGAMDYNPNIDALRWFFAKIHAPLRRVVPNYRLLIVGKDPVAEVKAYAQRPNVMVTGAVPDVRPYYREAWLQIVPLRIGGGTRLKIVESMAMETPVISTTIGAQGLGLQHEHDVLFGDSPAEFIVQTARALRTNALRDHLAANGSDTVRRRLSWPSLGRKLLEVYDGVRRAHGGPLRSAESVNA